jgi:Na+-transporting NADH:ubiquinone oxidoreductase subunit A
MKTIAVKNRCRFRISGKPGEELERLPAASRLAAAPSRIPLIRWRLLVKRGDEVEAGAPIAEDKRNTAVKLVSPAGGRVSAVEYGPRRVIEAVVVDVSENEPFVSHERIDGAALSAMSRNELVEALLIRGLWPLLRNVTFRTVADTEKPPAAIWVPLQNTDPFHPAPSVYLGTRQARNHLLFGLRILQKLSEKVYVYDQSESAIEDEEIRAVLTHRAKGPFPAADPGVMHYRTKSSPEENRAWFVDGQDLCLLGEGMAAGRYPVSRIIAVSGGGEENHRHVLTRLGAPLLSLPREIHGASRQRWITGGVFTGRANLPERYLGLHEKALVLVPEPSERELLGFARPGFDRPTCSRTFLSAITKPAVFPDVDRHGELRACVNCSYCAAMCPVGILPQYTYKAIYASELEEALAHGLLDCVECGLCSYVCPSKLELTETLRQTKQQYYLGKI